MNTSVQIGPVEVPIVALAGIGGILAVAAVVHGATRPVPEYRGMGPAQERTLKVIDRRLDRLSRERREARERIEKARKLVANKKATALPAKVPSLEKREDRIDDIARRIESRSVTPSEIRELMASGALSLRT